MKIVFEHIHSPVWVDESHLSVTLCIKLAHLDQELPFTSTHDDVEPHGRELYLRAVSGEFGPIAEYIPPTPLEIAARENPLARQRAMALAITHAQHQEMMGNQAMSAAWKTYYQQVYALNASPNWPTSAEWPEVPA